MERDLTTGSIRKNLLYMSVPTMLGFLFQNLYDIVDMIWIGRISAKAIAAVTIYATIYWLVEVLNEIIGTSSVSLISQNFGKKDIKATEKVIEQTLVFKFIVAGIAAFFLFFALKPLSAFFTDDKEVYSMILDYGYIRTFFMPLMFSSFTVNTALRCIGDSKSPMKIMAFSSVLNIVLDPILMFDKVPFIGIPGFGLGIYGAALATVISITLSFILGMWILTVKHKTIKISLKGLLKLDKEIDTKLVRIGLPTGMEMLLRNLSGFVMLKFVAIYGTMYVATMGISFRLLGLLFMPLIGLSMGSSTIVGQNLGIDNIDRANDTAKAASKLGVSLMSIFVILGVLFPESIIKIFVSETEVIKEGALMLRIVLPSMLALGAMFGIGSVFSGSGYNLPFLVSSVLSRWGVQIPVSALMVYHFSAPIYAIWIIMLVSELIEATVVFFYYLRGKWKFNRV